MGDPARARRHHDQLGAHEQRLFDAVGDEEHRLARCRSRCSGSAPAPSPASARPARRAARPSAGPWGRRSARARCRHAAACRPTACRPASPRTRRRPSSLMKPSRDRRSARPLATPCSFSPKATLSQHVQPGQQRVFLEHHRAVGARSLHPCAVQQDLARGRRRGSRRSGSAAWTCRSPRRRAPRRSRPRRCQGRSRCSASTGGRPSAAGIDDRRFVDLETHCGGSLLSEWARSALWRPGPFWIGGRRLSANGFLNVLVGDELRIVVQDFVQATGRLQERGRILRCLGDSPPSHCGFN